jgi:hypothetical protein
VSLPETGARIVLHRIRGMQIDYKARTVAGRVDIYMLPGTMMLSRRRVRSQYLVDDGAVDGVDCDDDDDVGGGGGIL